MHRQWFSTHKYNTYTHTHTIIYTHMCTDQCAGLSRRQKNPQFFFFFSAFHWLRSNFEGLTHNGHWYSPVINCLFWILTPKKIFSLHLAALYHFRSEMKEWWILKKWKGRKMVEKNKLIKAVTLSGRKGERGWRARTRVKGVTRPCPHHQS